MKAHLVLLAAGLTYAAERTQQLPGAVTATTDPTPKVVWGDCVNARCTFKHYHRRGPARSKKSADDGKFTWKLFGTTEKCPQEKCASELCIATRKERPTRGFAVDCSVPPKNKVPAQGKKKRNFKGKQKRGIRQ